MTEENTEGQPNVIQAITRVMADIGPVKKTSTGDVPYNFRGIDDVMNALNPALTRHGVVIVPHAVRNVTVERLNNGRAQGVVLEMAYRIYGPRADYVEVAGVGGSTDYSDKAPNQAMSMAYKYAILESFCIATQDMQDGDKSAPTVDNASSSPPTVDLSQTLKRELSLNERKLLREAWSQDYSFGPGEVPQHLEAPCRQLILSYKGTSPDQKAEEKSDKKSDSVKKGSS